MPRTKSAPLARSWQATALADHMRRARDAAAEALAAQTEDEAQRCRARRDVEIVRAVGALVGWARSA